MRIQFLLATLTGTMFATQAFGQDSISGAISGVVHDENRAVLVGVTVVATSPALQGSRTAITDRNGVYTLVNLPPGNYVVAFYFGDTTVTRRGVVVRRNKNAKVNPKINVGNSGETITIEGRTPVIDQSSTSTGTTITSENTRHIPSGRTFDAALGAAAGSQGDAYGVSFGGSTSLENSYVVDGVNTNGTRGLEHGSTGTEEYADHGTNPMVNTRVDRRSTFAIDVDTASYTIARTKILSGVRPPPASVRVEEFLNYFRYSYRGPRQDAGAFAVHMDAAPSPFTDGRTFLRIGVQARKLAPRERKKTNLVFLVDVSGSMSSPDKLELAKRSLDILVNNLQETDTVALVTYAGNTAVRLEPTPVSEREKILAAIEGLDSSGSTAMGAGIDLAYELASEGLSADKVSRVIVLSDGDANVGNTSHDEILATIAKRVEGGVTLTTVGFGMGNYKDHTMEQLANKGNGNNYYIDSITEARKIFGDQLEGTLEVVAKDVKIQVEFNQDAVTRYRLIGYENRDIADDDFRNDKVDAGEIGAGHTVTAMYEVELAKESTAPLATVRLRAKTPRGKKAAEQAFTFDRRWLRDSFGQANADFRFASAVVGAAEILRDSEHAENWSLSRVVAIARDASKPEQSQRQEFISLIERAGGQTPHPRTRAMSGSFYRSARAGSHGLAGIGIGGLMLRGGATSKVALLSSLRIGYGRGATDVSVQFSSSRRAAEATIAQASTSVGDSLSVYSLGAVLSHRFFPDARVHPVGGFGIESLMLSPEAGGSSMALAALARMGIEVAVRTNLGAVSLGFDATGHLPLAQEESMPTSLESLVSFGTYLDVRF